MSSSICRAELPDLKLVSGILMEAIRWMEETGTSLWTAEEVGCSAIERDVGAGDYFLLAVGEEAVATFLMQEEDACYWPDLPIGEALFLHRIAIRRASSGKGHAKAIVRYVVEMARERGLKYIRLDCDSSREGLNSLYRKLGFRFHSAVALDGYHGSRYQLDVRDREYA